MGSNRNLEMAINRVTKERTALFFNSDDPHRQPANLQGFADGVGIREKLVFDIAAKNTHQRRPLYFICRNETAVRYCLVFDIHHVGRRSKYLGAGKLDIVLLQISLAL